VNICGYLFRAAQPRDRAGRLTVGSQRRQEGPE